MIPSVAYHEIAGLEKTRCLCGRRTQPQEDDADDEEESQHKMSGKTSSLPSLLELTDLWTQIASQRLQKNKTKQKQIKQNRQSSLFLSILSNLVTPPELQVS
jgi:hypothetical protein